MTMRPIVLSIDDEHEITDLLSVYLEGHGYEVITAASGREALAIVRQRCPDLILLDLMLPDIDGFSLCEILRSSESTAHIPVIVVTAWVTDEARSVGRELGAIDYLTKPFSTEDLLKRVRRLIKTPSRALVPKTVRGSQPEVAGVNGKRRAKKAPSQFSSEGDIIPSAACWI